jgi:hypothetical protein
MPCVDVLSHAATKVRGGGATAEMEKIPLEVASVVWPSQSLK